MKVIVYSYSTDPAILKPLDPPNMDSLDSSTSNIVIIAKMPGWEKKMTVGEILDDLTRTRDKAKDQIIVRLKQIRNICNETKGKQDRDLSIKVIKDVTHSIENWLEEL